MTSAKVDSWVWGNEKIIWGFDPAHRYTFKVLEPKKGRPGCLSLQYHHEKSETWLVFRGLAWGLFIVGDEVTTRIMRPGDAQNIPTGIVHRLMAVSENLQVLEPSTPDKHAADKNQPKDVVRLHCVQGRPCDAPRNEVEARLVQEAVRITEEAIAAIEKGALPLEYNPEKAKQVLGGYAI